MSSVHLGVERFLNKGIGHSPCFITFHHLGEDTEKELGRNHKEEQTAVVTWPRMEYFPEALYLNLG